MKIVIQNLQKKIPISPEKIKKSALKVLQIEKIKKAGQISFLFVRDRKIRELNLRFRGEDRPTDILSFDISRFPKDQIFADIVISVDAARSNAKTFRTSIDAEICLYVIHGLLHLIGYDDRTTNRRREMYKRQKELLGILKHKV